MYTIKLNEIMHNGLHDSATTALVLIKTHFQSLGLVILENPSKRQESSYLDDAESTIGPAPATRIVHEVLTSQRASEGRANKRSAGKSKGKSSVPQPGCIGDEDLQNEVECIIANPVEHIACCVGRGTIASRQYDETENVDKQRGAQSLSSTPNVQDFTDGKLEHTTHDAGQDIRCTDGWRGTKLGKGCLLGNGTDGRLEGQQEETNPDPMQC